MTPAVELIGLGIRTDSSSLMATSRGSSSHSINTQQPVFMWGCFHLSCVVLCCTCLQELKAHVLPLTNVAFDKSGSRWVGKPRRLVLCPCVCSCVTRAYRCTCSGSWQAATTGRVACGTRPRAASCTRCRVTGTWCTPWLSITPTGNLLQFAVPDTRGRPRSTPPFPPLGLSWQGQDRHRLLWQDVQAVVRREREMLPHLPRTQGRNCACKKTQRCNKFVLFFLGGDFLFLSLNWQFKTLLFFPLQIVFHQEGKQAKHCGNVTVVKSCANCHVAVNWCFVSFGQKKFFFFPGNFYD